MVRRGGSEEDIAIRVLHVEDDDTDAYLVLEALDDADRSWRDIAHFHRVPSAEAALEYLRSPSREQPHLILLDINLPGRDGHELLAELKSPESPFGHIPVLILSTSGAYSDIERAYQEHAASYLVKPTSYLDLIELMGAMQEMWLRRVEFPLVS